MSNIEEGNFVVHYENSKEDLVEEYPVTFDPDNMTASLDDSDIAWNDVSAAAVEQKAAELDARVWSEVELAGGYTIPATLEDDEDGIAELEDEYGEGEYVLVTLYAIDE